MGLCQAGNGDESLDKNSIAALEGRFITETAFLFQSHSPKATIISETRAIAAKSDRTKTNTISRLIGLR